MFFPQIFSAVGSSSLVLSVKLQVKVCNIKVSGVVAGKFPHFLPFIGKTINCLIQFFHRSYSIFRHDSQKIKYESVQEERGIQRVHRPQRISNTIWRSHQKHLRICVLQAQRTCLPASYISYSSASSQTRAGKQSFNETILTAHVFRKIFVITNPASNILQSEKIDRLIAVRLVETTKGWLPRI